MSNERVLHQVSSSTAAALARKPATEQKAPPSSHPLLNLQRQIGNRGVVQLLQALHDTSLQREDEGGEAEEEEMMQGKHDPAIQRVEEEEMMQGKHDPAIQRVEEEEMMQGKHDSSLQREDEGGEAEEEEPMQGKHDHTLQARHQVGLEGGAVGDSISSAINEKRGGGSGLDDSMRANMEGAFGTSFGDVRVHQDSDSDSLTRSVTSKAFTTGSDVFLRGDQNANDTSLMAHELTHVVQQRSMSASGPMSVRPAGDQYEQEADKVADVVVNSTQRKPEFEG